MNQNVASFKNSKGSIVLLGLLIAFGPLTIDMYLPSLPILTTELDASTSLTQLSLTACLLGLAFGQLINGSLSDIYGRRKPLITALTIYIVSSILCAFSSSIWFFILMRFIQGLSGAGGIVIARSCARDLFSGPQLTKIFSLLMLVMGVAPILAPIIGGQLLQFVSWRGIFIVLAFLGVTMLLTVAFRLPETLSNNHRSVGGLRNTLSTFQGLLSDRTFMGFALIQGLVSGAMFSYISGSSFVFQEYYHVSPQGYSFIFGMNAAGIILASQITGRLAGRVKETKMLKFGLILAAFGSFSLLTVFLMDAKLVFVLISMFLVVATIGVVNPTCTSLAMQSQGKSAGSASALLGLLQFTFGGMIAPLVGIAGSENVLPLGIIITVCELLALICFVVITRINRTVQKYEKQIS
ncbi:multidrug effflux MFS transporter [Rossellomorea aquimaris]|uniref:multidrug effflux MFS transporter n=1 Tax=Rossellomorea aquimaris TaxID=189382 RepID=UPI000ABE6F09|nr:multidrug effflux MFS transporter [Rossellomorea aquimaris]